METRIHMSTIYHTILVLLFTSPRITHCHQIVKLSSTPAGIITISILKHLNPSSVLGRAKL